MLSQKNRKTIENKIAFLFANLNAKFLGPRVSDRALWINYDRSLSLPGMYEAALKDENGFPSYEVLDSLIGTAKNYLEALRLKTTNRIIQIVENHLNQAEEATPLSIETAIKQVWPSISANLSAIIDHETQTAKNVALIEGIVRSNQNIGIDNPIVGFLVVHDKDLCLAAEELVVMSNWEEKPVGDLRIGDRLRPPTNNTATTGSLVKSVEKKQALTLCLKFDNNRQLICTYDHPLLVRAGPTYTFVEAQNLKPEHDVVFLDENLSKGEYQKITHSLGLKSYMRGYNDAWHFWKINLPIIIESLRRTHHIAEIQQLYNIERTQWDKFWRHILKVHAPDIKIIGGTPNNHFNAKYLAQRTAKMRDRYKILGGDSWLYEQILLGKRCIDLAKQHKLLYKYLRKRLKELGLLSVVRSRGGRANWKQNRNLLIAKAKARGTQNFVLVSKPENRVASMLKDAGFNIEQTKPFGNIKVDIYLPKYNIVIEYDGSGHWMQDKLRNKKVTAQNDYARDVQLRKIGLRILRIDDPLDVTPLEIINVVNNFINSKKEFWKWHASYRKQTAA